VVERVWQDHWTDGMVEEVSFGFQYCKIMRVKHIFQTEYELNGRKLQDVAEERDLGILVQTI